LRWPLIIAAIIVVARVVAERTGVPESVNQYLGIFMLTVILVPLYFGWRLARSGVERPYRQLFALVAVYAVLVRAMVVVTYWLARIFEWPQSRFAGTWGPEVGPLQGFVLVPIFTALFWVLTSVVVGGGLGSLVIALARPRGKKS
jgi:hypothetical protein